VKKYNLSHIFIYHDYLVVVFASGAWELICLKYYFRVDQTATNPASAEAAAKATIDQWVSIKPQ
jgi:hypothetical protein